MGQFAYNKTVQNRAGLWVLWVRTDGPAVLSLA